MHRGALGSEKNPREHTPHVADPIVENSPDPHWLQFVLLFRGLKLPSGQFWHVVAAMFGLNLPGRQSRQKLDIHAATVVENVPAWQAVQASDAVAPFIDWYVPAPQEVQSDMFVAPIREEYLPSMHNLQLSYFLSPNAEL